ncbi:PREDICTED: lamin tail domain-containing protein 2 [Miniopterus natalensis]|uniref:lamin tail domain-containing protein 2 n=1 Tax=Miniopterus natalensis TaxID=291302 RepID=UPI0007A7112C|nr:PREDICTED: lamin tail domain-containing protein 2 [Miniopterus natalensis]
MRLEKLRKRLSHLWWTERRSVAPRGPQRAHVQTWWLPHAQRTPSPAPRKWPLSPCSKEGRERWSVTQARPARGQSLIKQLGCWLCRLAPESLDPHTLRLLWRQRELEIQALRYAIQKHQNARHCHVLQEVAGLPFERSSRNQGKLLQIQVQKLTQELKQQKEQAHQEKVHLEEQLVETTTLLKKVEAQLEAFQRSCLLQLASSSWLGRTLKSSTGSVEVVTAESLMDPSDPSESDEPPPAQEGFRLEDVDWNTVAHRYPNLFTNIKPKSGYRHSWPRHPPPSPLVSSPDKCVSDPSSRQVKHHFKSVEWTTLPIVGTSSSGGVDSDSSWPDERFGLRKVTGHPPQAPGHISFQQMELGARSFSRDSKAEPEGLSPDLRETHSDQPGKSLLVHESSTDSDRGQPARPWRCGSDAAQPNAPGSTRLHNQAGAPRP